MSNSPKKIVCMSIDSCFRINPKIEFLFYILVHNYLISLPFQIIIKFVQNLFRFQTNSVLKDTNRISSLFLKMNFKMLHTTGN